MENGKITLSLALLKKISKDVHSIAPEIIQQYTDDEIYLIIEQDEDYLKVKGTIYKEDESNG